MLHRRYFPYVILLSIILVAAFLRLYRIGDYMTFLGDEGRDALVVKRMIVDHKFTLLGPITSVGLMHLGPIYYYFMAPFLWLSGLDPVGPAIMVALFSLATIGLVWKIGQEFFSIRVAAVASLLYALSPLVIIHSHSSWNPNVLPFWALLIIYSLMQVVVKRRYSWLFVAGLSLGVALQLHYIALVFIPIIIVNLVLVRFSLPIKYWFLLIGGWFITFSPFIIFELRNKFINTTTVYQFITRSGNAKSFGYMTFLSKFWDLSVRLFWRLVVIENAELSIIFFILTLGICVYLLKKTKKVEIFNKALTCLIIWYAVGIGLLSFYTGNVYDYYLMFTFPLPFLLTGIALSKIMQNNLGKVVAVLMIVFLIFFEVKATPILKEPNRLATQSKMISEFIIEKAQGQPYNFGLIAAGNSDHAYRYFLEIGGNPPVIIENPDIDPDRNSVTDQLFVVCEEKICQPLGHPVWEIAGFGRAEITDEWQVGLFKVFKLVPYEVGLETSLFPY